MDGTNISHLTENLKHIPFFRGIEPSNCLEGISFFEGVEPSVLDSISDCIIIKTFEEGEVVCRHGKFDEAFYVILRGEVKAVIPTEKDHRYELYRLGPGDFFGEEVAFSKEPRDNTIIAESGLFLISMDATCLRSLMEASEAIKNRMDQRYIERKLKGDLRRVPIFTNLETALFSEMLGRVELEELGGDETIFREGDSGDSFYLIRDGDVKVLKKVNGREQLIAILSDSQFFGEMALMSDETRNATVKTSGPVSLVKLTRSEFLDIMKQDNEALEELSTVVTERIENHQDAIHNPQIAHISRSLLDLNRDINRHLDIISQCTIDTKHGKALLATMPGSRYPYVYPRDSACASRFLYRLITSPLRAGDLAFSLFREIARFILHCQREDGYWGQRYGIGTNDKGIYKQEDNVAHGVSILCRYLLAAKKKEKEIAKVPVYLNAIKKGATFARTHYYRNEIHLFYSTTSIHESAIEQGYSIWVNYAYLLMLRLIEQVAEEYNVHDDFREELKLKKGFESTIDNVFSLSDRYVRRLKPDGIVDLRPDITLFSPFFFATGLDNDLFQDNEKFKRTIEYIEDTLWDPDLDMLQRYLPFIEDPDTHIHAGNGPWIQYTAMLAQYYFYAGNLERGNEIMAIIDSYKSREGYLCEHLTTPERFYEFKNLEWLPGSDYDKEFAQDILVPDIPYDNIVEELSHMKNAYDRVEAQCIAAGNEGYITFASPLMWSHSEYAMALMLRTEQELKKMRGV